MYIEGSSGVMYRVYDPIAHTTENCVLRILHLDMTTNKKNYFTFTCLFVHLVVLLTRGQGRATEIFIEQNTLLGSRFIQSNVIFV